MKTLFFPFLAIILCANSLFSQSEPFGRQCLTPIVEARLAAQNPAMESREAFELWLSRKMAEAQDRPRVSRAIYTIPVVVHIIHEGEAVGTDRNIPLARVQSQIDVLNEDFRRMAGTPGFNNHPDGADIEIEFCLAEQAPDGTPLSEVGVHRVDANAMNFNDPPYIESYIDGTIKPATIWDPYRYCNIWVTDLPGSPLILGYARFPRSSGLTVPPPFGDDDTDGVVIDYDFFGRDGDLPNPSYNQGRSCTHEIGHWLGLVHIWGDANSCSATDYCDDTPSAAESHEGCPTSAASCFSADMYENYMDYTDDVCMNVFTNCQKLRMRTVIENSPRRKELLASSVCAPFMSAPEAEFIAEQREGCPGLVVDFTDSSDLRPSRWEWQFPGGVPSTSTARAPRVKYSRRGAYAVSLKVSNDFGSDSIVKEGFVVVRSSSNPTNFFFADFEDGLGEWTIENPDSDIGWTVLQGIGGSRNGQQAVGIENYIYNAIGERDRLISPNISLLGKEDLRLEFDYAYRAVGTAFVDSLYVRLSTDGGQSYPNTLVALGETGLRTFATNGALTAAFTPVRDADWCYEGIDWKDCNFINLNEYEGESNVRLMFESVNANGNNIFIDNVRINGSCAGETPALFDLFPNPTRQETSLGFFEETAVDVQVDAFDLAGKRIFSTNLAVGTGYTTHPLELPSLPQGTYVIRVIKGEETGVRKLVIWE